MPDFDSVANTSTAFLNLLKREMVPTNIKDENGIMLCNPQEKGDATLGIYLYDMVENTELTNTAQMTPVAIDKKRYPPEFMTLYYMITAFSTSDIRFRAIEEQRLLGRVVQILKDNSMINGETFEPEKRKSESSMTISLQEMTVAEKMKLWNVPDMTYKVSLFYKIDPVLIESNKFETYTRVKSVQFTAEEKGLDFSTGAAPEEPK